MFRLFSSSSTTRAIVLPGLFLISVFGLLGCSGSPKAGEAAESVSGKVTLDGEPVSGMVYFVGSDKKEGMSAIKIDGTYSVSDPPKGDVQILVKGMQVGPPAGAPAKKDKSDEPPPPTLSGKNPPEKYSKPGNGLKFTVTGGKQTYDIQLTP